MRSDSEDSCDESTVKMFTEEIATLMQREMSGGAEDDTEAPFKQIWEELVKSDAMLANQEEQDSDSESADSEAEWVSPVVGPRTINPLLNGLVEGEIRTKIDEQPVAPESIEEQKLESQSEKSEEEQSEEEGSEEESEEEVRRPVYTNRFALLDSDEEDKPAPKRRKVAKRPSEDIGDLDFVQGGGVVTETLVEGDGDRVVKIGDLVKVNYDGRLKANGKRFDIGDSTFMVGGGDMIIGFDSGVRGMRLHERRRIHIPYKLGYGKKGKKPKIPPNSDLIFDVVLNHVGIDWDEKAVSAVSQSRREKMRQRNKKVRKT